MSRRSKPDLREAGEGLRCKVDAIAEITEGIQYHLLNDRKDIYFAIDAGFLDEGGYAEKWKWLGSNMAPLVETTMQVSRETQPHRLHRVVLIPDYPVHDNRKTTNTTHVDSFRKIVVAVMHYHLWHGVVCYPVFTGARTDHKKLIRQADYGSIDGRVVFAMDDYYSKRFAGMVRLEGTDAAAHTRRAIAALAACADLRSVDPLYYTPEVFTNKRLRSNDPVWKALRGFFSRLYDASASNAR